MLNLIQRLSGIASTTHEPSHGPPYKQASHDKPTVAIRARDELSIKKLKQLKVFYPDLKKQEQLNRPAGRSSKTP